jgi:hypothetical protein
MRRPILSIVLTLLTLTALVFTFNVQKAKSTAYASSSENN